MIAKKHSEADGVIHDLNGLKWHSVQIRKAGNGFCTDQQKADAQKHI